MKPTADPEHRFLSFLLSLSSLLSFFTTTIPRNVGVWSVKDRYPFKFKHLFSDNCTTYCHKWSLRCNRSLSNHLCQAQVYMWLVWVRIGLIWVCVWGSTVFSFSFSGCGSYIWWRALSEFSFVVDWCLDLRFVGRTGTFLFFVGFLFLMWIFVHTCFSWRECFITFSNYLFSIMVFHICLIYWKFILVIFVKKRDFFIVETTFW